MWLGHDLPAPPHEGSGGPASCAGRKCCSSDLVQFPHVFITGSEPPRSPPLSVSTGPSVCRGSASSRPFSTPSPSPPCKCGAFTECTVVHSSQQAGSNSQPTPRARPDPGGRLSLLRCLLHPPVTRVGLFPPVILCSQLSPARALCSKA